MIGAKKNEKIKLIIVDSNKNTIKFSYEMGTSSPLMKWIKLHVFIHGIMCRLSLKPFDKVFFCVIPYSMVLILYSLEKNYISIFTLCRKNIFNTQNN